MNIVARERGEKTKVTILDLEGTLTLGIEGSRNIRETLRALVKEGKLNVIVNLKGVSYLDSSGVGELVAGYVTLSVNGGKLVLLNLSDKVKSIITVTNLYIIFGVFGDEDEAVQSFQPK